MTLPSRLILASGSVIRAEILKGAGAPFQVVRPDIDEDAIKRSALDAGRTLGETAQILADAKALAVTEPEAYVIGSDQILGFKGKGFDKPRTMTEARERLKTLQGKRHTLINAVSVAKDGEIVFRNLEEPALYMRAMTDGEIDAYLSEAGREILSSVGAYQVEALGGRLFDKIEGDYFAVLGLSLFPLLGYLRREGFLSF